MNSASLGCRVTIFLVLSSCLPAVGQNQFPSDQQVPSYPNYSTVENDPQVPSSEAPTVVDIQEREEFPPGKIHRKGGFGFGGGSKMPGYAATWYPSVDVKDQRTDFSVVRQSLNAGVPVWRNAQDVVVLTTRVKNALFFTDAILPDTGRPFPDALWDVRFGLSYIHHFENGWTVGLMPSLGSASDQPFDSADELNYGILTFLRIPARNNRDSWRFSLFYSSAGNLNFPIPGIAYNWNPHEDFSMNIGIPFSLFWRPRDNVTIDLSYLPLTNVKARITVHMANNVHLYGGYEFLNEAYFLADRENTQDRFMGFEQRLISGIRWSLFANATLDLNAGYAFDRHFGEGANQGADLIDRVDISSGGFLSGSLRLAF
ncbi:MAG: DUF6268 family outer membrane beta-barrel protein [Gemmataceae bacterium]